MQGQKILLEIQALQKDKKKSRATIKRLERNAQKLRISRDQALEISRIKSMFVANMSHEIRTPINAILGYIQIMLQDRVLPAHHHRSLESMQQAGSHLLSLINDILDISKIESGTTSLDETDFMLWDLVQGMEGMFKIRCDQKGLLWLLKNSIQPGIMVHGDQRKLRQILINFLGNAVKFTDSGGVTLRVKRMEKNQFIFEVEDTGPGIAVAEQKSIFHPFHQAKAGLEKGGTGLGLAISSRHIEMMGGTLDLKSELGEGCHICAQLPLMEVEPTTKVADNGEKNQTIPATDPQAFPAVLDGPFPTLPEETYQRLYDAVDFNEITDLKSIIVELRGMGPAYKKLAEEIEQRVVNYDMDGIMTLLEMLLHE